MKEPNSKPSPQLHMKQAKGFDLTKIWFHFLSEVFSALKKNAPTCYRSLCRYFIPTKHYHVFEEMIFTYLFSRYALFLLSLHSLLSYLI